jgi:hypothetical protein
MGRVGRRERPPDQPGPPVGAPARVRVATDLRRRGAGGVRRPIGSSVRAKVGRRASRRHQDSGFGRGRREIHFCFAARRTGTVSISLRDRIIGCVTAAYFLNCGESICDR